MGIGIEIDVFGDKQLNRELIGFGKRARNPQPAFEIMGEYLFEVERRQFISDGQFASGGWEPLKGPDRGMKGILKDKGKLFESVTNPDADGSLFEVSSSMFRFGTSVPYAIHHQHGAPRANLPQRRVIELRRRDRETLVKILSAYLRSGKINWDSAAVTP